MGKKSGRGMDNVTGEEFQRPSAYGYHVPYISHANFSTSNAFPMGAMGSLIAKSNVTGKCKGKGFIYLLILNKKMVFVSMYS